MRIPLIVLVVALCAIVALWLVAPPPVASLPPYPGHGVSAPTAADLARAGDVSKSDADARIAVPVAAQPSAGLRTFDAIFADLVALHVRAVDAAAREGASAPPVDRRGQFASDASSLFSEMLATVPDAGMRTVQKMLGLPLPWAPSSGAATAVAVEAQIVVSVARVLLDVSLQRMTNEMPSREGRRPLVAAMIAAMAAHSPMASVVHGLLHRTEYLDVEHEVPLIGLAKAARGDLAYLAPMVRDLLVTLWGNLGAESNARVGDLLLYFESGGDAALRAAAVARLILSDRYRELVVARLIELQDLDLMQEACNAASRELPFAAAVEVLAALRGATDRGYFLAYTVLAERFAEPLVRHYEETLGQANQPRHREQIVAAVGHDRLHGPATAKLAFDQDSDPRVRGVALLALAAHADVSVFRVRFERVVTDPSIDRGFVVNALRNHARRADVNWLDGITTAMLAHGGLTSGQQHQIEQIRATYVPK
jgi:hypothetical protein